MRVTKTISTSAVTKEWLLIDASNLILGRLATKISHLLRGKHKVYFSPNIDCGTNIVVINASKIVLTGKKWTDKIYYSHSQYPGGLKSRTACDLHKAKDTELVRLAVKRMLPKNRLCREQIKSLHIYGNAEHKHQAQKPKLIEV